uniref:CBS domain-containing protein n=1 Tax=Mesocestoides corti TaxID=53468 RepID=A0A5K3EQK0_MESCO
MLNMPAVRKTMSEGSICTIRMLISFDDRAVNKQDFESVLVNNLSLSVGTPAQATHRTHSETNRCSHAMHHLLDAVRRRRGSVAVTHEKPLHCRHSSQRADEFSGSVALITHHTGLLLGLPNTEKQKTVHFVVGKQDDDEAGSHHSRWSRKSKIFQRHSACTPPKCTEDEVLAFPLRRSVSLGKLSEGLNKCMDVVLKSSDSSYLDFHSLYNKKTFGRRIRRVARGLNLKDMHWLSRKHSTASGVSIKSLTSYEAADGEVALMSSSLKIHTDEVTPLRSLAPANLSNSSDSKSHHVGRFVVLKATVSNVNEESVSRSLNNDVKLNSESNATTYSHDNHYWTVSGGRGVLLTAPGARRADDSRPTSSGPGKSVHTRFRQFFVENLRNSRLRTHSEQQHSGTSRNAFLSSDSPNKLKPPVATYGAGLPPHAHTITAGTGSAVAKALLQSTQRSKDDGAIGSGSPETSGISSSPIHGHYPSVSVSSVNDSEASIKPPKRKLKSTHKMVRRLLKLSSGQKKHEFYTGDLPDPSKLPREFPQSSLEFTQSRLKNVPRRSTPTHNYGRKGKSVISVGHHPIIPSALATQGEAKSEELLLSAFSRSLSGSSGHRGSHHSHHHHHGNGHHHHHKHHSYYRGHYGHVRRTSSRLHHPTTLTRVTENSRYLMFTKASPFRVTV